MSHISWDLEIIIEMWSSLGIFTEGASADAHPTFLGKMKLNCLCGHADYFHCTYLFSYYLSFLVIFVNL